MSKKIKKQKYHNEAILIHCIKREPHTLIFDNDFINYRDFEIVQLCEDLEANYNYLESEIKRVLPEHLQSEPLITLLSASSLVWAGLFHCHNDIVPQKYKEHE